MADRNHIVAQLGPTNTGKTHGAIERMLELGSGVMGLPLRLLAREVYERVRVRVGDGAVALVTGEERIEPPGARYTICTVESMPVHRTVDFVAVDEIQLATHRERGHTFTDRLLHARGREETWFLGSDTMREVVRAIAPTAEIVSRSRLSQLRHEPPRSLSNLPGRTAVVAFSVAQVYALADRVRAAQGGAAVVLGALSPRARNAQVEMYQAGDVSHLVATDAIGMGLNLDIQHVFFGATSKFDGHSVRRLFPWEMGQVAGRAGRYLADGQFGLTREAAARETLPVRLIQDIELQRFETVRRVYYRNSVLDFDSPQSLRASLRRPAPHGFMRPTGKLRDELALELLLRHEDIALAVAHSPERLALLWEVCRVPDFRQAAQGAHVHLLATIFRQLVGGGARIDAGWIESRLGSLVHFEGGLDVMMQRVAFNRTWAYLAHRRDWVTDTEGLRERILDLEERLSTALHERLTEHFVEERTQVRVARPVPVDVVLEGDDVVSQTVPLGVLRDFSFVVSPTAAVWFGSGVVRRHGRSLCIPEATARASRFAQAASSEIELCDDLRLRWEDQAVARLVRGPALDRPELRLLSLDLLDEKERDAVRARAQKWVADERRQLLSPLDPDDVRGPLRGLLYLVSSHLGVVPRKEAESLVRALTAEDKKRLGALDVRMGAKFVYARALLKPAAQPFRAAALAVWLGEEERPVLPDAAVAPRAPWPPEFARRLGYPRYGARCVRVDLVERVAALLRKAVPARGVAPLPLEPIQWLGCSPQEWEGVVAALGYEVRPEGVARRPRRVRAKG